MVFNGVTCVTHVGVTSLSLVNCLQYCTPHPLFEAAVLLIPFPESTNAAMSLYQINTVHVCDLNQHEGSLSRKMYGEGFQAQIRRKRSTT